MFKTILGCILLIFSNTFFSSAWSHAFPKKEEPAPNSSVIAPTKVSISFNEELEAMFSTLWITDSKDQKIGSGSLDPQNPYLVIMQLSTPLNKGVYQVHWKVLSRDGHTTKGDYYFSVK